MKVDLREIAECTHHNLCANRRYRWAFREGVVDAAVAAAAPHIHDELAVIDAVEKTFLAYRISINPRWDGSIA